MPVSTKIENIPEHLIAEWPAWDADGNSIVEALTPNDVLYLMAEGLTMEEIAESMKVPIDAVLHVVACIPEMMILRSQPQQPTRGRRPLAAGAAHQQQQPPAAPAAPVVRQEQVHAMFQQRASYSGQQENMASLFPGGVVPENPDAWRALQDLDNPERK